MRPPRIRSLSIALVLLACASVACACSIPVFRYALERWQPDRYLVFLFHRGELTAEQKEIASRFEAAPGSERAPVNVEFIPVDLDASPDPELLAVWETAGSEETPQLVVQTPFSTGKRSTVWSGAPTPENIARLLDSPVRQELGKRLLAGDSVVWLFLESGEKKQDDAAYALLTKEIAGLQQTLKIPELAPEDTGDLSIAPEKLALRFSAIRLSRDDPAEQMFVEMLLRTEPDLKDPEFADKPMAFPVFGRGRVLYALLGAGIAPETIAEASQFLSGACQCTVKEQSPGADVIMAVDWDKHVVPTEEIEPIPPLAGLGSFSAPAEDADSFKPELTVGAPAASDAPAAANGDKKGNIQETAGVSGAADAKSAAAADAAVSAAETQTHSAAESAAHGDLPLAAATESEGVSSMMQNVLLVVGGLLVLAIAAAVLVPKKGAGS